MNAHGILYKQGYKFMPYPLSAKLTGSWSTPAECWKLLSREFPVCIIFLSRWVSNAFDPIVCRSWTSAANISCLVTCLFACKTKSNQLKKIQTLLLILVFSPFCKVCFYLSFNYKTCPYLFLSNFHDSLQNGQPKTSDYVHNLKKEPVFFT